MTWKPPIETKVHTTTTMPHGTVVHIFDRVSLGADLSDEERDAHALFLRIAVIDDPFRHCPEYDREATRQWIAGERS